MRGLRGAVASMIFQEPMTSLNPVLTIGFQIAETLINHRSIDRKTAEAEALRILERVRVPAARQRLHDYPHRFSGGMRQRVMIAIALACRPKLLIADEPTTALDVTVQADILELIKSLQDKEDMSVVFITDDMGVVAEIADRVVVMWKGRKVEEGAAAETLTRPRHAYTRALIAAVPRLGSMKGEPSPKPFPEPEIAAATLVPNRDSNDRGGLALLSDQGPLLEVANLVTRFTVHFFPSTQESLAECRPACMRWKTSPSRSAPARPWRSSASQAAANRRPAVLSCGWSSRVGARSL